MKAISSQREADYIGVREGIATYKKRRGRSIHLQGIENFLVNRRWIITALHIIMILFYLSLILIPPLLPRAPESAGPFNNFVLFSHFIFWYIWWPLVVLSMILFGRAWCGFLCPEGALSAYASPFGGNLPVPNWMKWGGIPLLAFIAITIFGQLVGVYEYPKPQLLILGGSTLLAIIFNLIYTRSGWVWCRYLCPVSLLFGVFSRLGALHFRVDHRKLAEFDKNNPGKGARKDPCPVFIYLPNLSTNRYCLMCFRCANWKGSIHLSMRRPGEELLNINYCEPLFWEVIFLFGAIGLPLGVFHWTVDPLFIQLKYILGSVGLNLGLGKLMAYGGPWWLMSHYPEVGEVFYLLDAVTIVVFILAAVLLSLGLLSLLTAISTQLLLPRMQEKGDFKELFTRIGYLYTPISLFSLFLGLSQLTFGYFQQNGLEKEIVYLIRAALLATSALWSLYLGFRIIRLQKVWSRPGLVYLPHFVGISLIIVAWYPVLFSGW